ncbi:Protein dehydration-induced 19 [Vigna unguiculata]|uniref:Protein dehydration-induced 19 n=1 Tax=Vigna unguiculata TaxID=3917 RepID=A0A4D6LFK8_VIGUN|nr:Protein dehydration-induced 19 [Vigna unguiculata]
MAAHKEQNYYFCNSPETFSRDENLNGKLKEEKTIYGVKAKKYAVLVKNIPPDPDESVSELVEHFGKFLTVGSEYMQRKRKSRKGGSYSTLSLLRKELREGNLQSLLGGSSCIVSSSNSADPLLSSFILPLANEHTSSQPHLHTEARSSKKGSDESVSTRLLQYAESSYLQKAGNLKV